MCASGWWLGYHLRAQEKQNYTNSGKAQYSNNFLMDVKYCSYSCISLALLSLNISLKFDNLVHTKISKNRWKISSCECINVFILFSNR